MSNFLTGFWPRKWPSKKQWKRTLEVLNKREKAVLLFLVFLALGSLCYALSSFYYSKTKVTPTFGGTYREGVVQSNRWLTINPLYASQSDVERDIIEVVFDGLMRYDRNGKLVPGLAKEYSTEDQRVFDVTLREDIYWSDGEEITAEDVVFTVNTILSPDFQSTLRQQWTGVDVEKISENEVRFTLDNASAVFPENLTLKIIPKHIFSDYSPRDFRYSIHNMKPVGSGPYRFEDIREDSEGNIRSLNLERNPHYFRSTPFINKVVFYFFETEDDLLKARKRGEIDGFSLSDSTAKEFSAAETKDFRKYELTLPRYFSLLFNLRREGIFQEKEVRKALRYATDKDALIEEVLKGKGDSVTSPFLPEFYGFDTLETKHVYDPEKAKELLVDAGFENGKKEIEDPFQFTKDLKEESQGEEVRNLQRCFIYLQEEDDNLYPEKTVTGFFDEETKTAVNYFQEKYKEEILDPHGFGSGTGMVAGSTREKLNELCEDLFDETVALEISITTLSDPMLSETAGVLKSQWEELGIKVNIEKKSISELREKVIRLRDFDTLLFGTVLTGHLNPLPLWHSSKIDDPGLNLSGYENDKADELLETIIEKDEEEKIESLLLLQKEIMEDSPGIFLYNPYFIYFVSEKVKGIEEGIITNSSGRFEYIDRWYINTKRTLK